MTFLDRFFDKSSSPAKVLFFQLFIAIWVSMASGDVFPFGIFTMTLKNKYDYTQKDIALVATIAMMVMFFSLPTGYIYDHFGPRVTMIIGAFLNLFGWGGIALVFYEVIPLTSVGFLAFLFSVAQMTSMYNESGAVLTNLETFSSQKGKVVIIQKTFAGLGTSIVIAFFVAFFDKSLGGFCVFLALLNFAIGILGAVFVKHPTPETRVAGLNMLEAEKEVCQSEALAQRVEEQRGRKYQRSFRYGYAVLALMIVNLTTMSVANAYVTVSHRVQVMFAAFTICLSLAFYGMVVLVPSENEEDDVAENGGIIQSSSNDDDDVHTPLVNGDNKTGQEDEHVHIILNDAPLSQNLRHPAIWMLWFVSFAVLGCLCTVTANLAQIYKARDFEHYSPTVNSVHVAMKGIGSAVGRVGVGVVHPILAKHGQHMVSAFWVPPLIMSMAMFLFPIFPPSGLLLVYFMVGLGGGTCLGSLALIVKGLFAFENVGKHYSFLFTAGALSTLLISVFLFAGTYDKESAEQGRTKERTCKGAVCIELCMFVCAGLNLLATAVGVALWRLVVKNRGIALPAATA